MAKIARLNANLLAFAINALAGERTVFGDVVTSDTLDDNFTADFLRGWGIVGLSDFPTKQDFNALGFTLGQMIAYLHQMGIAEWNVNQEFHLGAVAIGSDFETYTLTTLSDIGTDPVGDLSGTWLRWGHTETQIRALAASNTIPGTIQIATDAEAAIGTDELKAVNPKQLSSVTKIKGYLFGLESSVNGVDAFDLDIQEGSCIDSTNTLPLDGPAMTKQIDAVWVAGTNAGGFPSAGGSGLTLTDATFYHVFLISKPDGTVDYGFDTNLDASVLLNGDNAGADGYTLYRRIWSVYYVDNATKIKKFLQDGDRCGWDVPVDDIDDSSASTAAILASVRTPLGIKTRAFGTVSLFDDSQAAATTTMLLTSPNATDTAPTDSIHTLKTFSVTGTGENNGQSSAYGEVMTDTSSQIRHRKNTGNADITVKFITFGYYDRRVK